MLNLLPFPFRDAGHVCCGIDRQAEHAADHVMLNLLWGRLVLGCVTVALAAPLGLSPLGGVVTGAATCTSAVIDERIGVRLFVQAALA